MPQITLKGNPVKLPGTEIKVGQKAPDFTVQDHTGKVQKLSDYRGKRVVLWFYPKADTPG